MARSVALIGFGAIAQDVLKKAQADGHVRISQILVRAARQAEVQARLGDRIEAITSVDQLGADVDFVLECAGHGALLTYGCAVLSSGIDLGVLSVGALADDMVAEDLRRAARAGGSQATIVPGAIGGIDAIAAAGPEALRTLTYTGSKAPRSWIGTPAEAQFDLESLDRPTEVFSGSARDAARQFPKNANVVATVALAGLGFDRTMVRLVADPATTRNTHRIEAQGPDVEFTFVSSAGTLPDNPRTSALTSRSALRALRSRSCPMIL